MVWVKLSVNTPIRRYQAVIASDKKDMEYMVRKLVKECEKWGLIANINKTKYLCIGADVENLILECNNIKGIKTCKD